MPVHAVLPAGPSSRVRHAGLASGTPSPLLACRCCDCWLAGWCGGRGHTLPSRSKAGQVCVSGERHRERRRPVGTLGVGALRPLFPRNSMPLRHLLHISVACHARKPLLWPPNRAHMLAHAATPCKAVLPGENWRTARNQRFSAVTAFPKHVPWLLRSSRLCGLASTESDSCFGP